MVRRHDRHKGSYNKCPGHHALFGGMSYGTRPGTDNKTCKYPDGSKPEGMDSADCSDVYDCKIIPEDLLQPFQQRGIHTPREYVSCCPEGEIWDTKGKCIVKETLV